MKGDRLLCTLPGDGLYQIRHDKFCNPSQFLCSVMGFRYSERCEERVLRWYAGNRAKEGLSFLVLRNITEVRFGQISTATLRGPQCH